MTSSNEDQGPPTAADVARWMLEELERTGELEQREAVADIEKHFGDQFVYINDNGNPAISPKVLTAFRKIRGDRVEWSNYGKTWYLER